MKRGDREERERESLVVLENSIVLSELLNDVERKRIYIIAVYEIYTRTSLGLVYTTHTHDHQCIYHVCQKCTHCHTQCDNIKTPPWGGREIHVVYMLCTLCMFSEHHPHTHTVRGVHTHTHSEGGPHTHCHNITRDSHTYCHTQCVIVPY